MIIELMKFIFCLGLVWSMDGQKPMHHFPTLVMYWGSISSCGKYDVIWYFRERQDLAGVFFGKKRPKTFYDAKLIFWSFATFFVLTLFWSDAKQRFCFRESISVLNQNGRIQALGFLARWWLTSHALYYKIP